MIISKILLTSSPIGSHTDFQRLSIFFCALHFETKYINKLNTCEVRTYFDLWFCFAVDQHINPIYFVLLTKLDLVPLCVKAHGFFFHAYKWHITGIKSLPSFITPCLFLLTSPFFPCCVLWWVKVSKKCGSYHGEAAIDALHTFHIFKSPNLVAWIFNTIERMARKMILLIELQKSDNVAGKLQVFSQIKSVDIYEELYYIYIIDFTRSRTIFVIIKKTQLLPWGLCHTVVSN